MNYFPSLDQLLDALMLAGNATMTVRSSRGEGSRNRPLKVTIRMRARQGSFGNLWLALLVLHRHHIPFTMIAGPGLLKRHELCFDTTPSTLFYGAYSRWYASGEVTIPGDISINEPTLRVWLAAALLNKRAAFTSLPVRNLKSGVAMQLAAQVNSIAGSVGWGVEQEGNELRVVNVPAAEDWLAQWLPRETWQNRRSSDVW